jgi:parvulin-like peptidyl-prolyl isomerase
MRRVNRSRSRACLGPLLAAAFGVSLWACGEPGAPSKEEPKASVPSAASGREGSGSAGATRASKPPAPRSDERYAASNILIAYAGAEKAAPSVTRTKEEAKALAEDLYAKIEAGSDFGALADRYSDGPERGHQGRLGVFSAAKMLPAIADTVAGLAEGKIAPPVESPMGYHLVRRDRIEEIYVAEIVVAFQGAQNAPKEITRSREEAQARAGEAVAAARAPGAVFSDTVTKYSDHPTRVRGGVIGRVFRGLLPPSLDALAFSLAPGEIGGPVEMPNGFTIIRRLPEAKVRHILIAYAGALRAPPTVTRSRSEAVTLVEDVLEKVKRGDDFGRLAREYSDCPSNTHGGELGIVAEGTMTPRFEEAVFKLAPGERSGVVETEFGFHIMERLR